MFRYYQRYEGRATYKLWPRNSPPEANAWKEVGRGVIEEEMMEGVMCVPTEFEIA